MAELNADEQAIVEVVREFVNREVKPVVRDLEHADTYPEKLIGQMKELGVFGLAIPEPWGASAVSTPCYALVTEELARGWMSLAGDPAPDPAAWTWPSAADLLRDFC